MTNLPELIPRLLASLLKKSQIAKSAQTILNSLYYRTLHSRRSAVAQTYEDTYECMFQRNGVIRKERCLRVGMLEWLEAGSGMFWVSGKAGSGKSTLMKLPCFRESRRHALETWAGDAKIVMANHFF